MGVGSFCYGFGISPMYYSWGFFLPEMREDITLTETQAGLVFSVFSYVYHLLGPLVGFFMGRWGIRSVVGFGSAVAVLAFWLMSRADSYGDCMLAFGVLGGIAIGFATILPSQTLASNWFLRYRARALAVVLGGGAVVGFFSNKYFGPAIIEYWNWRTGWLVIAAISAVVGLVGVALIRSRPEDVGQLPDGGPATEEVSEDSTPAAQAELDWTPAGAIRTYQFYVLVALAVAYGVPWGVISVYGRSHLENLGFPLAVAGSILGWRVLASLVGRLSALGGDYMTPQRLLAGVLLVEGVGTIGLVFARTEAMAYASVVLIGLGFGAAYVTIPVSFASFYGRRAFGATVGARFAITGLIGPAAPTIAGMIADATGSYEPAFLAMASTCLIGALIAFWLPHPGPAPEPKLQAA